MLSKWKILILMVFLSSSRLVQLVAELPFNMVLKLVLAVPPKGQTWKYCALHCYFPPSLLDCQNQPMNTSAYTLKERLPRLDCIMLNCHAFVCYVSCLVQMELIISFFSLGGGKFLLSISCENCLDFITWRSSKFCFCLLVFNYYFLSKAFNYLHPTKNNNLKKKNKQKILLAGKINCTGSNFHMK